VPLKVSLCEEAPLSTGNWRYIAIFQPAWRAATAAQRRAYIFDKLASRHQQGRCLMAMEQEFF
jgi:hypothetical protein